MKPGWAKFAKPQLLTETKQDLVTLRNFMRNLSVEKQPFVLMSSAPFGCDHASDINISVTRDFINRLLPTTAYLPSLKTCIRSISERINLKIDTDWKQFLQEEHEEEQLNFSFKCTNADVESSFAFLKDNRVHNNTSPEIRILRAWTSFNRISEWLETHPKKEALVREAATKENRMESKRKSSENMREYRRQMKELELEPAQFKQLAGKKRKRR